MALYGCGRPAYWVFNMPTGRLNNMNRDHGKGSEGIALGGRRNACLGSGNPNWSCVKGTGPESKTH